MQYELEFVVAVVLHALWVYIKFASLSKEIWLLGYHETDDFLFPYQGRCSHYNVSILMACVLPLMDQSRTLSAQTSGPDTSWRVALTGSALQRLLPWSEANPLVNNAISAHSHRLACSYWDSTTQLLSSTLFFPYILIVSLCSRWAQCIPLTAPPRSHCVHI